MVSIAINRIMPGIAILAGAIIGLFVIFIGLIWLFQERVAFQPERAPFPTEAGLPRVDYSAVDGQPLFAYIVGDPANGLVISFHGNADLAVRQVGWAEEIVRRTGVAVMIPEYRGYMGLSGKPTYERSQLDAEAAYRYAVDSLQARPDQVALFGHSLGTAIAAELAVRHRPAALILQSPFTSAREMSEIIIGHRPTELTWNLISRLHFDTKARVASLDAPVSVSHGENDRLIPPQMGRSVFDAAMVKGEWLLVRHASHNDVGQKGDETYWRWLISALRPLQTEIHVRTKKART